MTNYQEEIDIFKRRKQQTEVSNEVCLCVLKKPGNKIMKYHKHIQKLVLRLLKNDIMISGCLDRNGKPGEDFVCLPCAGLGMDSRNKS
jgi:hypothetical protein